MKKTILLLVFCLSLFFVVGCSQWAKRNSVEVVIDGNEPFPEFLVGSWQTNKYNWEIVFEADGSISSAVIPLGMTRIVPGQKTIVPMKMGGKGIWEPGQWVVQYSPAERVLSVEIEIEKFSAELGKDLLKGNIAYIVSGPIDNNNDWQADVISFPNYAAYTPKKHDLPMNPIDTQYFITFKKAK